MDRLDTLFLRIAIVYLIARLLLGIGMAASGDHGMMPAHAHINLVGWVTMALFGLVYRAYPNAARTSLARAHFWVVNVAAPPLTIGVLGITAGYPATFEPLAIVGSIVYAVGVVIFALVLYIHVAASAPTP
jgi:hypothetical protein